MVTTFADSEHADHPPQDGASRIAEALTALTTVPEAWAQTVLFLTYDENGGFFDHVAPPVPPAGTPGELLTAPYQPPSSCTPSPTAWVDAPIGLGFRVPMTVISPFSRGGFVCSDTFDHTSMLRFVETRFAAQGVQVPNLTPWRRSVTGDLTTALDLASPPRPDVPVLPLPAPPACSGSVVFPLPAPQTMPVQPIATPRRPSGCVAPTTTTTAAPATTVAPSPVTPAFTG